jgi:hypothetical protein
MSGSLAIGAAFSAGAALTDLFIKTQSRSIATLIPDVVVEEQHRDDLVITEHPVEFGSNISDHAYKRPAEVHMRCGWTNSSLFRISLSEGYVREVYQQLLVLQAVRVPFTLVTGKRTYQNMLIASLGVTTDARREYALDVQCTFRQVILVRTQSTTRAPNSQQADASKTGGADGDNQGDKQAQPADNKTLSRKLYEGIVGPSEAPSILFNN